MNEFLTGDTFGTIMGGVIILFLLVLAWKVGPRGQGLFRFSFGIENGGQVDAAVGVFLFFAETAVGQRLGGVGTGLIVILVGPFVLLGASLLAVILGPRKKSDRDAGEGDG